ncbi:ABC transporter substrate-binding protein [Neobacillus sp. SM06]|uniref:ABC transporter substrate-binding protein n=1 Tax=Neobacillus sp. SM06 TaxID=3422492 RepID=UPI003D28EA85
MLRKKQFYLVLTLLLMFGLVTACGSSGGSKPTEQKNTATTLKDAMGEVAIPANPKRIVAPYLEDSLVALGVKPAAQWSIGETVLDYLQPELKGVPKISWDLPLEQVISKNPDLLIFSSPSAIQKGQYEEYKKIAPTYVFKEEVSADWRQQLSEMGKIVNKQTEAKTFLQQYNEKAAEAKARINQSIVNQTAAILWVMGDKFYLFEGNRFAANVLYEDLGVKKPAFVESIGNAATQWNPITLEKLPEIKADHLFLISKKGEPGLDILTKSSVWNGIDAVKKGKVHEINDPSYWTINGAIASKKVIDDAVTALTK